MNVYWHLVVIKEMAQKLIRIVKESARQRNRLGISIHDRLDRAVGVDLQYPRTWNSEQDW